MERTPVLESGIMDSPSIDGAWVDEYFGFDYRGYIHVPETGIYDFYTASDDGSILYIGDEAVVMNDGSHGIIRATGRIALRKGFHRFHLLYFQDYAGKSLAWGWKRVEDTRWRRIDKTDLYL